jgi:hypothetical protein
MTGDPLDRPADDLLAGFAVVNDLRGPAAQALLRLGELRLLTRWDDQTLCAQLGCDLNRWIEIGGTPAAKSSREPKEALARSLEFLDFVSELTQMVDLTIDRRVVVSSAFELCHNAGVPVDQRVARVREALERSGDGDLTPSELLSFGEVARAWRLAALNMGSGPAYDRAASAMRLAGPIAARTAHLSPERMALLEVPDVDAALGVNVRNRMLDHLLVYRCAKCRRLAESLGLTELLRARELVRHGDPARPAAAA